jgi:hypothetical protein
MLIVTNKMHHNTISFIAVKALHVSGGFPAHHQELKNCTCSIWYLLNSMEFHLNHVSSSSNQALQIPDAACTVLELLMTGGETA